MNRKKKTIEILFFPSRTSVGMKQMIIEIMTTVVWI